MSDFTAGPIRTICPYAPNAVEFGYVVFTPIDGGYAQEALTGVMQWAQRITVSTGLLHRSRRPIFPR